MIKRGKAAKARRRSMDDGQTDWHSRFRSYHNSDDASLTRHVNNLNEMIYINCTASSGSLNITWPASRVYF